MKKTIWLFFIFFIAASLPSSNSLVKYAEIDSLALKSIDLVHQSQFEEALQVLKEITNSYPEEPIGYFYTAAAYQNLIDIFRNEKYKKEFEQNIEIAIQKADKKLNSSTPSARDYFYAGASYG